MDLGFFTMPIHPLDKDWRQCLHEDKEAFVLAEDFSVAWQDSYQQVPRVGQTEKSFVGSPTAGKSNSWRNQLRATLRHSRANPTV